MLGPILYLLYTSPLGDIVRQYSMGYHFYADDTQLYLSFNSLSGDDRDDQYRPCPSLDSILVGDHRVKRSDKARNIGVVFDETLSLDKHVSSVCKSALFHLWNIAKIRMYLTSESTETLVHAYVTCRLDNCNWPSIKPGTWNIPEHSGTSRNIPEHPGTSRNIPEHRIIMRKNV